MRHFPVGGFVKSKVYLAQMNPTPELKAELPFKNIKFRVSFGAPCKRGTDFRDAKSRLALLRRLCRPHNAVVLYYRRLTHAFIKLTALYCK